MRLRDRVPYVPASAEVPSRLSGCEVDRGAADGVPIAADRALCGAETSVLVDEIGATAMRSAEYLSSLRSTEDGLLIA